MSTRWLTGILYLSFAATFFCLAPVVPALAQDGDRTKPEEEAGDVFKAPRIILGTQEQPVYPPAAFDARYTGSVLIEMMVLKDGSVSDIGWAQRSGDTAFDLEAQGAVEAAGRSRAFGPLPKGYARDRLRVSFYFDPRS